MSPYHQFRRWMIARGIRRQLGAARRKREFYAAVGAMESGDFSGAIEMHIPGEPPRRFTAQLASKVGPGRQHIAMPAELGMYGARPWSLTIPTDARSAPWEDLHRFAAGAKPKRDPYYGLMAPEPPLSMVCVICELVQTPIRGTSEERTCAYCGLKYRSHGTRVFWWREPIEVPEWSSR